MKLFLKLIFSPNLDTGRFFLQIGPAPDLKGKAPWDRGWFLQQIFLYRQIIELLYSPGTTLLLIPETVHKECLQYISGTGWK